MLHTHTHIHIYIYRCVAAALGMTLDWRQRFHTVAFYLDADEEYTGVDVTIDQRVRLVLAQGPAA